MFSSLTTKNGFVPLENGHGFGLYHNDCRFLDGYVMAIAGAELELGNSNADVGNAASLIFFSNDKSQTLM